MRLENQHFVLEVDDVYGAITRLWDRASGLEALSEPRLAGNFRLLLPLLDLEANYLVGAEQNLTACERTATGLRLEWAGPLRNAQGEFELGVVMHIEAADAALQFRLEVSNRTQHRLAEVWYPVLGGLQGLGEAAQTQTLVPYAEAAVHHFFVTFPESMGIGAGGGLRYPEFAARYPGQLTMPWVDFSNPARGRGFYFANHDLVARSKAFHVEAHPGLARNRAGSNWPRPEELAAQEDPAGLVLSWAHFPYTPPGESFEGPEITVEFHDGDWHEAAALYRTWFFSHFPKPEVEKSWLRTQVAVQDTMFLLPEGNLNLTYRDIPAWARGAREGGVTSLLISGWDLGGHDNLYPNYHPDPRLGTWEELRAGIAACHELGMRVYFFVNLQPVDCTTDWYRQDLHRYRISDQAGWTSAYGFGMGTLGARLGLTHRPMVDCNPAYPAFREIIVSQMVELARLGADGVHVDKLGPGGRLDFNPDVPVSPDRAEPEGVLRALEEILTQGRAVNPEFEVSVESAWDRTLSYAPVTWMWHDRTVHLSALRATFPEWAPTLAVAQPWDFANINASLRYGYQLLVGPARYTASLADPQYGALAAYLREVLRIRRELLEVIDLGEFLDTREVTVEAGAGIGYSAHRDRRTGRRACVLVNEGAEAGLAQVCFAPSRSARGRYYLPFEAPRPCDLPVTVTVAGDRFAVVAED